MFSKKYSLPLSVLTDAAASGSTEIAKNIDSVSSVSRSTTEGANNSQQAARELSQMATELQGLVNKFKVEA